jgi:hypothetical protein
MFQETGISRSQGYIRILEIGVRIGAVVSRQDES